MSPLNLHKVRLAVFKSKLMLRGYPSMAAVARELGCTREAVRQAVNALARGRMPGGKVAAGIQEILERPPLDATGGCESEEPQARAIAQAHR